MIPEVDPSILSGYCFRCGVPVIAAGDPGDTSPMVCEHCAEGGHPGIRGHVLPDYALAWAYARDEWLNASVCRTEAESWNWQASILEECWGPDDIDASILRSRARQMLAAAEAFDAVAAEQECRGK